MRLGCSSPLIGTGHTPLAPSSGELENRRMNILRLGVAVVIVAGLDAAAPAQPASTDQQLTSAQAPRTDHALGFYDLRLRRVVLVGGAGDPKEGDRDKVWSWSGTRWELVTDAGPPGRVNAGAAYDARSRKGSRRRGFSQGDGWRRVGSRRGQLGRGSGRLETNRRHRAARPPIAGGRQPRRRPDVRRDSGRRGLVRGRPIRGSCKAESGSASRPKARPAAAGRRLPTTANAGA